MGQILIIFFVLNEARDVQKLGSCIFQLDKPITTNRKQSYISDKRIFLFSNTRENKNS